MHKLCFCTSLPSLIQSGNVSNTFNVAALFLACITSSQFSPLRSRCIYSDIKRYIPIKVVLQFFELVEWTSKINGFNDTYTRRHGAAAALSSPLLPVSAVMKSRIGQFL